MSGASQAVDSPNLRQDLHLSYAFINGISAAYQGIYVFENVMRQLNSAYDGDAGFDDEEDRLHQTSRVLEKVDGWWDAFAREQPLIRVSDRPVLDNEASKAWRLLDVAESRLRSLVGELSLRGDMRSLVGEPLSRNIRAAALCEAAYSQLQYVRGLIAYARYQRREDLEERWRQRLLACRREVQEADDLFCSVLEMGDDPDEAILAELLDCSLLLPARFGHRIVDFNHLFSRYTGVFDYPDAGIPEAQVESWKEAGFKPYSAGLWFVTGLTPLDALDWVAAGAADPLTAAAFMWRGFDPEAAEPWLQRQLGGRSAAAWSGMGCSPDDAVQWISQGVHHPRQLMGPAVAPDRLM